MKIFRFLYTIIEIFLYICAKHFNNQSYEKNIPNYFYRCLVLCCKWRSGADRNLFLGSRCRCAVRNFNYKFYSRIQRAPKDIEESEIVAV